MISGTPHPRDHQKKAKTFFYDRVLLSLWRTVRVTFPFVVPLQPCCVVLYLPWWLTLFELLQGSQFPFVRFPTIRCSCSLLCSSSYIVMSSDVLLSILMLSPNDSRLFLARPDTENAIC